MTQEDLKAIGALMDQKLQPLKQEIAEMRDDIADIQESLEETRNGVNMLIGWSEKVSMAAKFPLPDIDE